MDIPLRSLKRMINSSASSSNLLNLWSPFTSSRRAVIVKVVCQVTINTRIKEAATVIRSDILSIITEAAITECPIIRKTATIISRTCIMDRPNKSIITTTTHNNHSIWQHSRHRHTTILSIMTEARVCIIQLTSTRLMTTTLQRRYHRRTIQCQGLARP